MALSGNIIFETYGQSVTLSGKYMRLREVNVLNNWQLVDTPQPNGADGLPVANQQMLTHVYTVSGTLDVHNAATDPEQGIAPIASKEFSCPFDPSPSADPQAQLYAYISTQIPGSVSC